MKNLGKTAIGIGCITLAMQIPSMATKNKAVAIIGGADGPTSIFVADKLGTPNYTGVLIGAVLVAAGLVLLFKSQK